MKKKKNNKSEVSDRIKVRRSETLLTRKIINIRV